MKSQHITSADDASAHAAVVASTVVVEHVHTSSPDPDFHCSDDVDDPPEPPPARLGWCEGHMPELVDPLIPADPETIFTETRHLRHDGWTPEKMRLFHERLAECGVVTEACNAAGMSARSAYNLRDRDPLFAAGWEAASLKARTRLADEAFSRSLNGVVDRIYKDGLVVAERHRYDNRLTMAVLTRLDSRLDRAEERGSPHLALAARWDEYLAALGEGRRDDVMALLAPPAPEPPADLRENARDRELRELQDGEEAGTVHGIYEDRHLVWERDGCWWTDYPPPADFDGEEHSQYGEEGYKRALTPAEQAVIEAEEDTGRAADLARAEAQRDAWFFGDAEDASDG